MRIIFLGTPEFAVSQLDALCNSKHEIVAVVTQPDKPNERGNKVEISPVKEYALNNGLPLFQFLKISRDGVIDLRALSPDLMVTAAYGQILSQEIIDIPKYGIINVHASLLPKYRGATPIQSSIIAGDEVTGVTIMKTEAGIDTGDMLISAECKIDIDDTYGSLNQKLSLVGARLCVEALDMIEQGKANFVRQNHEEATHTRMIKKEHTLIDFGKNSQQIVNLVRGLNPNPIAYFMLGNESYKVFVAKEKEYCGNEKNGTILCASSKQGLVIKCDGGAVEIVEMTAPNSKKMLAKSYLNGKALPIGSVCNE
jgi:methionyl-tRNA formyltransferase